ncbi:MAG: glutamyl-tRNA reductase [Pyrinomonadaceae bacterium]|nr:glutamyl-tRNA reductase [Pyrinomonadaceae bacterium]
MSLFCKALGSSNNSILFAIGINHKTAPVEFRERIYIQDGEISPLLAELKKTLDEAVIISTCNRLEIYGVTTRTDLNLDFYKDLVIDFKNAREFIRREDFFGLISCSACQQLFRVTTSLDSKIIGDMQILGQVKDSFRLAEQHKSAGKVLHQMFERSFKIGKQVWTETNLHKGIISISSAAVELAAQKIGSLKDKTVLIIGAGNMARLTAEYLLKKKAGKIFITNRTRGKAEELFENLKTESKFNGEVIDFANFKNYLNEIDVVISSTSSPLPILEKADFANQINPILLIDIAVPRDISPETAEYDVVELNNIDDLNAIVDTHHQRRMADLPKVNQLIMKEMSDFLIWYYSLPLLPSTMQAGAKPDAATQKEIVRVKELLLGNLPYLHKLAMQKGTDFAGHIEVVNQLTAMKEAAFEAGVGIGA